VYKQREPRLFATPSDCYRTHYSLSVSLNLFCLIDDAKIRKFLLQYKFFAGFRVRKYGLSAKFRIPTASDADQQVLAAMTDLQNTRVYALYGLTEEELEIVTGI